MMLLVRLPVLLSMMFVMMNSHQEVMTVIKTLISPFKASTEMEPTQVETVKVSTSMSIFAPLADEVESEEHHPHTFSPVEALSSVVGSGLDQASSEDSEQNLPHPPITLPSPESTLEVSVYNLHGTSILMY